jgi:hypothetical protein
MMLDPDLVDQRKKLPKSKHPQLFGWTAQMSLLADVADLIYKQATGNPRAALPRPLTAADFVSHARRQARMNLLIQRFSPRHVHLTPQIEL